MTDDEIVYVAMLMPNVDGSGDPAVLGVYSEREGAEARCWRCLQRLGYDRPTAVFARALDKLPEDEEDVEMLP